MIDELIDRFADRVPAALLFHSTFARVFSDDAINEIFCEHRGRQVQGRLLFSSLIRLLVPVVSGGKPTVHAAYQSSDLEVSCESVYQKLRGIESQVSAGLLRGPVSELVRIQEKAGICREDVIEGYHTYVLDGKKFDGTEHRLKETRFLKSAPLPGMAVTVFDTRHEMFVDIECERDAYRCERKVMEPIADRFKAGSLYMGDRNFCDGLILESFIQAQSYFLVRQHGRSPRWREIKGEKRKRVGKDSNNGRVYEQVIEVRLASGSWCRVRRITVELKNATRNKDTVIHLLSNLPASVSGTTIADAYRQRWKIETCLGYLSQALNAEINTLCYPAAASLCFCLALTLFNIMSTMKAVLLQHSESEDNPEQLSYYYMAHEIAESHTVISIAIDDDHWQTYASMTITQFVAFLKRVSRQAKLQRYKKHIRGPKKPPPKRKSGRIHKHVSTQRILNARL